MRLRWCWGLRLPSLHPYKSNTLYFTGGKTIGKLQWRFIVIPSRRFTTMLLKIKPIWFKSVLTAYLLSVRSSRQICCVWSVQGRFDLWPIHSRLVNSSYHCTCQVLIPVQVQKRSLLLLFKTDILWDNKIMGIISSTRNISNPIGGTW